MNFKLSKDDSGDIGFALDCLASGAIQFHEFKEWLYYVIEHCEDPPDYIYDMLDVKLRVDFKPDRIMGYTAGGGLTNDEYGALQGFSFHRGISDFEDVISRSEAIVKMNSNIAFKKRVSDFFPFLDMDAYVGPDPDKGW